jgi:hypothetical protein
VTTSPSLTARAVALHDAIAQDLRPDAAFVITVHALARTALDNDVLAAAVRAVVAADSPYCSQGDESAIRCAEHDLLEGAA